jgi:hypothetical protein
MNRDRRAALCASRVEGVKTPIPEQPRSERTSVARRRKGFRYAFHMPGGADVSFVACLRSCDSEGHIHHDKTRRAVCATAS